MKAPLIPELRDPTPQDPLSTTFLQPAGAFQGSKGKLRRLPYRIIYSSSKLWFKVRWGRRICYFWAIERAGLHWLAECTILWISTDHCTPTSIYSVLATNSASFSSEQNIKQNWAVHLCARRNRAQSVDPTALGRLETTGHYQAVREREIELLVMRIKEHVRWNASIRYEGGTSRKLRQSCELVQSGGHSAAQYVWLGCYSPGASYNRWKCTQRWGTESPSFEVKCVLWSVGLWLKNKRENGTSERS